MNPEMKEALRNVDWLRVINRVTTLIRAARHDRELELDQEADRDRAARIHRSIDRIARQAVGCALPARCDCLICTDERD